MFPQVAGGILGLTNDVAARLSGYGADRDQRLENLSRAGELSLVADRDVRLARWLHALLFSTGYAGTEPASCGPRMSRPLAVRTSPAAG
jgi:hypothetical protein